MAYFIACLHSQSKSKFIFKDKKNFINHFGFNNSYGYISWTSKQFAFMNKIVPNEGIKGETKGIFKYIIENRLLEGSR